MKLRLVVTWSVPSGPGPLAGSTAEVYEREVDRPYPCVPQAGDTVDLDDAHGQPASIDERSFLNDGTVSLYFGLGPDWAEQLEAWGFVAT